MDQKKLKKRISNPNSVCLASNRIIKKYRKERQKGSLEKTNKKSTKWLKKAGFLQTDDLEIIDYDVSLDDLETIDLSNNTQMTYLTDAHKIDLKNTSATKQAAKKIIKKI